MQQILNEGNNIGDWDKKVIKNLNPIYVEAERLVEKGYKMYARNLLVESFVIFMKVTKFYDIVCKNSHLIISNKRHLNLKRNFNKIIPIMEIIKPQLIEKYQVKQYTSKIKLPNIPQDTSLIKPVRELYNQGPVFGVKIFRIRI